ncbi:unnamed protein product [Lactuca saligna]|uniref:Exostosin GT47 domain-containing protein n=1 Tax=Lactuca saligna TaxID=75948 RepID=A0AA35VER8_LACSI|nr:unnamed protein product [Lactuca saligna]
MAAATKFLILLTILSLSVLLPDGSPINETQSALSLSSLQDDGESKVKENDITLARIEEQLAKARGKIRNAIVERSFTSSPKDRSLFPKRTVYKNPFAFFQSHTEMMKTFKIWTYKEGDAPLMHDGPMKLVYSIEGDFIEEMEREGNPIVANHPDEAHAFFIPLSVTNIVHYLFTPEEAWGFRERMQAILEDYIKVIAQKYPYWNRSNGADHFYVSCHDWGPFVSTGNPKLFKNFIRVLCNANSSEGFDPSRDVSMTESTAPFNNIPVISSGHSPYNRSIFAFFAGGIHGDVRKRLFEHWGNNEDKDIQVYNYLPKGENHTEWLTKSKYCLCPSGYEVASSRLTEAIYVGCVPVIIKKNYVIPYNDVLDWSQFSVQVPVDDIPNLKKILQAIPFSKYLEMQKRLIEVQRHFAVNIPAKPFDVLHMIFHSVWLRRLNVRLLKS